MALNTCVLWFNDIKIAIFSKKITKNHEAAGGEAPRFDLSYTSLLETSPI